MIFSTWILILIIELVCGDPAPAPAPAVSTSKPILIQKTDLQREEVNKTALVTSPISFTKDDVVMKKPPEFNRHRDRDRDQLKHGHHHSSHESHGHGHGHHGGHHGHHSSGSGSHEHHHHHHHHNSHSHESHSHESHSHESHSVESHSHESHHHHRPHFFHHRPWKKHPKESNESRGKKKFKIKKKYKKFLLPLLLAYKLKFFTLIPVMIAKLILLLKTAGLAGFFFALFAATMSLKGHGHYH